METSRMSVPPEERVSIYDHILAHIPEDGPWLLPGGERLPDEPERDPEEGITVTWAPGLIDEILERGTVVGNEQAAGTSLRLIEDVLRDPSAPGPYDALIEDLRSKENVGFLDPLVSRVYHAGFRRDQIRDLALRLATRSSDRMPVKVGIALLGLCATIEDRDTLLSLGRHEEFTHYVGITLTNAFPDVETVLWELAQVVVLWGRINLVRQLATTRRPEIKEWILKEATDQHFFGSELAYIAATTCELAAALRADEIDDVTYRAAGQILLHLIEARPSEWSEDIDDYEDGPEAIRRYLWHVDRRTPRFEAILPIAKIVDYLELRDRDEAREMAFARLDREDPWSSRRPLPKGWTNEERERSATFARWILQRPAWRELIDEGLRSDDGWVFDQAETAATWFGDDTFPVVLDRARRRTDDSGWYRATTLARDAGRWNEVLDAAYEKLMRHESKDGPMFPHWLTMITQEMQRFPGMGWPLFRAALQSPLRMERRFGVGGLGFFLEDGWIWPSDADDLLDVLARTDPDRETRGWATELLESSQSTGRVTTP